MFPLRIRSYYSLMLGTMSPATLCSRARSFGYDALAMTDRDNLYGLWSFLAACRQQGLKSVIGAEISEPHTERIITCLVKTAKGYGNLCKLISKRHGDEGFCLDTVVGPQAEGLLVLCRDKGLLELFRREDIDLAVDLGAWPTGEAGRLKKWAERKKLRVVATHDCGMGEEEDHDLFVLLRAIAQNKSHSETLAEVRGRRCNYFSSPETMKERFAIWPEVVAESYRLAQRCCFTGPDFGLVMPPWSGTVAASTKLRELAFRGAVRRYGDDLSEVVVERLEHELQVIESMNFSSYFLVVQDIVHRRGADGRRKKRRICGRGSGAASLVAYCLEITNVCPIKYNLYFERFLNPGRTDPPDIDIDFAWDERDHVLAEVFSDYKDHVAMVCNHIFFKPRMAIRETAKAYGMPGYEISRITKKLPWFYKTEGDLFGQVERQPTLKDANLTGPWPGIIALASKLIGIPRYLSVHPGGVVITPQKISNYVPIETAPKGVPIIQWEKDGTEEAGLVKIDLLGNRSLGVIRDCINSVKSRGEVFDDRWEPEDDVQTQDTIAKGATMGCFYIESPAMRLLQQKAGTGDYEQLVLQSSIIRPAANEFVREYVRRLHGGAWKPLHEKLGDVLDETFGLMVYQEDVSRVAVQLAGFSHARADGLRKIISKKDREFRLIDYKQEFARGCAKNNIGSKETEAMWDMMMSFDGYSFCKPHSASYARVSFQAAYLKTYFPAEFMAAVISNRGGYYSSFAYVSEAKRLGIKILRPDINLSMPQWRGRNNQIRVGLLGVQGLSQDLIEGICSYREQSGTYRDSADFFHRTEPAEDEARALIHAGALDSLQPRGNRTILLWELASYRRLQTSTKHMPLFPVKLPDPPKLPPPHLKDQLRREYDVLGFLCDTHPIALFSNGVRNRVISRNMSKNIGRKVCFAGWLLTGKLVSTRTGEVMEFLTFEDEYGVVETTFFPRVYKRYAHKLRSGAGYLLYGLVEEDFGAVTLTVDSVRLLKNTN